MSSKQQKSGSPFLYDPTSGHIVGLRHPDGLETLFLMETDATDTPVNGVQATKTTDMTNANADVTLTAVDYGVEGNLISITYTDPSAASQALAVYCNGKDINVSLATGSGSAISSTAAQVVAAINAHSLASKLVTAAYEGTGAGVVNAVAKALLTGGVTCTPGDVGAIRHNSSGTWFYRKTGAQAWLRMAAEGTKHDEVVKSATGSLAATDMQGTIVNNYGQTADAVISLAAAAKGLNFTVILGTTVAKYFRLDPASGDSIYLAGTTTGDGKYVGISSAAAGAAIQFKAFKTGADTYDWIATALAGTWAAEAA